MVSGEEIAVRRLIASVLRARMDVKECQEILERFSEVLDALRHEVKTIESIENGMVRFTGRAA